MPLKAYIEALVPEVMASGSKVFGKSLGLNKDRVPMIGSARGDKQVTKAIVTFVIG